MDVIITSPNINILPNVNWMFSAVTETNSIIDYIIRELNTHKIYDKKYFFAVEEDPMIEYLQDMVDMIVKIKPGTTKIENWQNLRLKLFDMRDIISKRILILEYNTVLMIDWKTIKNNNMSSMSIHSRESRDKMFPGHLFCKLETMPKDIPTNMDEYKTIIQEYNVRSYIQPITNENELKLAIRELKDRL